MLAGFTAHLTPDQATSLAQDANVVSVEPNRAAELFGQTVPAGITQVAAPAAQARGVRGANIKVGVIDTGIDLALALVFVPAAVARIDSRIALYSDFPGGQCLTSVGKEAPRSRSPASVR